jgi:glycosyltransferase involved in cell wall biosynthesis
MFDKSTAGKNLLNTSCDIYGEIAKIAQVMQTNEPLRFERIYYRQILCTSDVCLPPHPPSPLNDVSTMIKIPEYMALGRAVASYALPESRVSAGDSALYAAPGDPDSVGRCVAELLDDPARRERMGAMARERIETELSWQHSEGALLAAYARVLSRPAPSPAPVRALTARTYL